MNVKIKKKEGPPVYLWYLSAHSGLDRVSDYVSRLQRVRHAVGTHRYTIAHSNGIEAETIQSRGFSSFLDQGREVEEVHIAGVAFEPDRANTHLRTLHGLGSEASSE